MLIDKQILLRPRCLDQQGVTRDIGIWLLHEHAYQRLDDKCQLSTVCWVRSSHVKWAVKTNGEPRHKCRGVKCPMKMHLTEIPFHGNVHTTGIDAMESENPIACTSHVQPITLFVLAASDVSSAFLVTSGQLQLLMV